MESEPSLATSPSAMSGPALIKYLAACNGVTRSQTLQSVISWLHQQDQPEALLSDDDFKKLWKGLFYCVWHCDKASNQASLINRLSSLLLSLPAPLSLLYFSHFLLTLRREWPGIDRLRLDKFYLMIRVFVRKLFELLEKKNWVLEDVEKYWGVLEERLFLGQDDEKRLGDGVTYHVVSVFCDEIKQFLPLRVDVWNVLSRPFVSVLGRTDNKVLLGKLKSDVFDYLLRNGRGLLGVKKSGVAVDSKDERVLFGSILLIMGFAGRFYELGSYPDCVQGNRKFLFGLHDEFSKLEKELELAGVDVLLPEVDSHEEDVEAAVPQLIPVDIDPLQQGDVKSLVKSSKKKKKDKEALKYNQGKRKKKKPKENDVDVNNDDHYADISIEENNNDNNISTSEQENGSDIPDSPSFYGLMLSDVQKQLDMMAAEVGYEADFSSLESPAIRGDVETSKKEPKKRKRARKDIDVARTGEKGGKRVKFSMKRNLVWEPNSPLPSLSLRIPPSVTPRGSALKKGVPPGPIREASSWTNKPRKKFNCLKKGPNVVKTRSAAINFINKLKYKYY